MSLHKIYLLFFFVALLASRSFGQCPNNVPPVGPCCPVDANSQAGIDAGCSPDCPLCPVDDGVYLLVAAGIVFGGFRVIKERKRLAI